MRKLYTTLVILTFGMGLLAQNVVLTQKTHGLAAGYVNDMLRFDFTDPGPDGKNQVWDLGDMESSKGFHGFVAEATTADSGQHFRHANVVLNEEGNQFFFCLEEDVLTAWGTMTRAGQVRVKYHQPFIKMKYPFAYGDEFGGDYTGTYYLSSKEVPIDGKYHVAADAYGTLILPGGTEIKDALRVVSTRSYDIMLDKGPQTYEIVTYRWYCNYERFPVAVILSTRSNVCNPDGNFTYSAYYKIPEAPEMLAEQDSKPQQKATAGTLKTADLQLVSIYPNPVSKEFTLEYSVNDDSRVFIELYDNTGNKVATLVDQEKRSGNYTETFRTDKYHLEHGIYHIRSMIGDQSSGTTFVRE